MGIFTAYLDDSGTHTESDVVVVAGFVSDASRWEKFSEEWQVVLNDYQLKYFHMTDFENSQKQFKEWCGQKHKECLNRFLVIIKKYALSSVGWAVPRQPFNAILSDHAKAICGDAYGLAALACQRSLAKIAVATDSWVEYVLESGTRGRQALEWINNEGRKDSEWRDNNRVLSLAFQDKRDLLPLQGADILAYELFKQLPNQLKGRVRPDRYPLQQLSTRQKEWHYTDNAELGKINEWLSRPRTESPS